MRALPLASPGLCFDRSVSWHWQALGEFAQNAQQPAKSFLGKMTAFFLRKCSSLSWLEWDLSEKPLLLLLWFSGANMCYLVQTSLLGAGLDYMAGLWFRLPNFLTLLWFSSMILKKNTSGHVSPMARKSYLKLFAFLAIFVMFCFCYLISWLSEKKMTY